MTGFNMPPGCSESDIPGNTPEDEAWEKLIDEMFQSGLTAAEARARWMNNTVERCEEMLIDSLREEIKRVREEKVWDSIKESAVFLLRGTVKDLAREDISNFDDGREFLFVMLPVAALTEKSK